LRDYTGQFVIAKTTWNQSKCSIIEGEAMALFEAMKEVEHKGFTQALSTVEEFDRSPTVSKYFQPLD
jgi:hypothetical protein